MSCPERSFADGGGTSIRVRTRQYQCSSTRFGKARSLADYSLKGATATADVEGCLAVNADIAISITTYSTAVGVHGQVQCADAVTDCGIDGYAAISGQRQCTSVVA